MNNLLELPPLFKKTTSGKIQIWRISVTEERGLGVIHICHGLVDGKQQKITCTIDKGTNLGKKNATTPAQQAVKEALAEWKHQRDRKHYGEDPTGDESAGKRSLAPMLAAKYKQHQKKIDWETAFAQPKLDGLRLLVRREDGKLCAISREGVKFAVPHILSALENVVGGQTIDGELYCHGIPINTINSWAKRQQEDTERLKLHVYDMVLDERYEQRYEEISTIVRAADSPVIELTQTVKVRSAADLTVVERDCLKKGYEGAILRHGRGGYEPGQRSTSLLKVKTFADDEFKIIDYKFGKGAFSGVPIFSCVTKAGNEFDVVAEGTMAEKRALAEKVEECIGRKLKISYPYYTKTVKPVPFQPVALGFADEPKSKKKMKAP